MSINNKNIGDLFPQNFKKIMYLTTM